MESNNGKAATEPKMMFPGVRLEEDEHWESVEIKRSSKAWNDDKPRKRSDEDDDYVLQSDADDLRHKQELDPDRPKKIQKVCALERSEAKVSGGFAANKAGEHNTSGAEHVANSEKITSRLRPLADTVLLQLPAGYVKASLMVKVSKSNGIRLHGPALAVP